MDPFNYRAGYTAVEAGKSMDKDMHSTDTTGTAQTGRAQHKQDRHSTGRAGTMTFAITPLFHLCFLYTRAKMNNFINVVNNLLQCCAAPCQQLLSTSIVHSCSRSTIIVTNDQQAFFINYCQLVLQQYCNNYCSLSTLNNY